MKIPELDPSSAVPRPWWLLPVATGQETNARLSLAHLGGIPRGAILLSFAPYVAEVSSQSEVDPGSGRLRWNHATQASATQLMLSDQDATVADHAALWSILSSGGHLYFYNPDDLDVWQQWDIGTVVDGDGFVKLGVTWIAGNGSFAASTPMSVILQQPNPSNDIAPVVDLHSPSIVGGVLTLDFDGASKYVAPVSLTGNATLAIAGLPGAGKYAEYEIHVTQASPGGFTLTLPASHKALGGSDTEISAASGATTVISASSVDNGVTFRYAMQESAA